MCGLVSHGCCATVAGRAWALLLSHGNPLMHYIHTCIHAYMHTYIRTYIHTYIPTYLHTCHTCTHSFRKPRTPEAVHYENDACHGNACMGMDAAYSVRTSPRALLGNLGSVR